LVPPIAFEYCQYNLIMSIMTQTQTKKYVLAIDLGTSGPKVALVSSDFETIASEFEPISLHLFDNGGAEQDPVEWWTAIKTAATKLIKKELVPREDIVAICCTAQWSGTVPVDKSGNLLMPAIIWMDSRGSKQIKKTNGGLLQIEGYGISKIAKWMRLTGGAPGHSGKDPIAHILYLKEKRPDIYKNTYKFLEPKDYLNLLLTGKFVSTYETITLHWVTDNRDINNIKYDDRLLKMTGLEREKLPDLLGSTDIVGTLRKEVAQELGLSEEVKVVGGAPDFHAAIIGSGAVRNYEACLCVGTSTFLSCHYPNKKTDIAHNMASLPSGIPGKYVIMNEQEISGGAIDFLKNNIFLADDVLDTPIGNKDVYQLFESLASSVAPGSDGLIFTPWLYGERTPIEDAAVRGGFYNMSLKTTRAHMIRATTEGIAYNTRWLLKYVEKFAKRQFTSINMVGGGAMLEVWCQVFADVLQREIHQVDKPRYANVMGAAALALVALKFSSFEEISGKVKINKVFKPNQENAKMYDKLFREFINVYYQNKKIYGRLNKKI